MSSNLTVDTLTKGATTLNTDELVDVNNTRVCKAWVNFNGTGTVAIRANYNVSSITDNGTGQYTINLTTAMPDINYSVTANASIDSIGRAVKITVFTTGTAISVPTTSSFLINATSDSNVSYDSSYVTASVFR